MAYGGICFVYEGFSWKVFSGMMSDVSLGPIYIYKPLCSHSKASSRIFLHMRIPMLMTAWHPLRLSEHGTMAALAWEPHLARRTGFHRSAAVLECSRSMQTKHLQEKLISFFVVEWSDAECHRKMEFAASDICWTFHVCAPPFIRSVALHP